MSERKPSTTEIDVFKYASLPTFFFIFSIPILILLGVSIHGLSKYGYVNGMLGMVIFSSIFFIGGIFVCLGYSDVIVDDQGVSRRLLGWVWRSISWDKIELIRIVEISGRSAQFARSMVAIVPIQSVSGRKLRSIVFSKEVDAAGRLVTAMNRRIAQYRIPVEHKTASSIVRSDHI